MGKNGDVLPWNAKRVGNGDAPMLGRLYLCVACASVCPALLWLYVLLKSDFGPPCYLGPVAVALMIFFLLHSALYLFFYMRCVPVEFAVDDDKCVYALFNGQRNTEDDSRSQWTQVGTVCGTKIKSSCVFGHQLHLELHRPSRLSLCSVIFTPNGMTIEECITYLGLEEENVVKEAILYA